ncbi:MAG: murein transglycosylase A [Betaproteobacteria bacterium]
MRSSQRAASLPLLWLVLSLVAGCATKPARQPAQTQTVPATVVSSGAPVAPSSSLPTAPAPPPAAPPSSADSTRPADFLQRANFNDLPGWADDDQRDAWAPMLASCRALAAKPEWKAVCAAAGLVDGADAVAVRKFFEQYFVPHQLRNPDGSTQGLVTGYYEPLLRGSRKRGGVFQTALHKPPADLLTIELAGLYPELKNFRLRGRVVGNKVVPYFARSELEQQTALADTALLWVDSPIEAFFLQVQGSGRVFLADTNETVRLAYADQNGHPYRSIGRYLVDRGELTLEQASMQGIQAWAASNPRRLKELLDANPSYVFFKEEAISDPSVGPKGALGVPLTAQRSIAIDPQFTPLGAPVFLSTTRPNSSSPLRRLMLAQDTGGAIRNPIRADFFWGFGKDAGELAGKMKQPAQMWVLLPTALAVSAR